MTSLETSLQQYRTTARTLFAARPTLSSVVQSLVQAALDQHAPKLSAKGQRVLGDTLWLGELDPAATYRYTPLSEVLLRRFREGWSPSYDDPDAKLVSRTPDSQGDTRITTIDLKRLGVTLNRYGDALLEVFKTRLVAFWNEPVPDWAGKVPGSDAWVPGWDRHSPQVPSRCAALSNLLFVSMYGAGRQPNSLAFQASQWLPKALVTEDQAMRDSLLGKNALKAYLLHVSEPRERAGITPVAVIFARQQPAQTFVYLLLRPGHDVQHLQNLNELWTLLRGQLPESGRLELIASQLNAFDNLAGTLLENQLQTLERLPRADGTGESWSARIERVLDPGNWFATPEPEPLSPLQRRVREVAPLWLLNATAADRRDYAGLLSALVTALKKSASHSLFDDVSSLSQYSRQTLAQTMARRHPQMPQIRMQDIQLTLEKYRRKPVSPDVLGEFEEVQLTLPELALENLDDFRFGATKMLIRLADNGPLPEWMTAEYLVELVTEVDIGARYPAYLRHRLLDDTRYASQRQQRFFRQIHAQLPLVALELKLRAEQGITEEGYRSVRAVLGFDAHERQIDGRPIVLRPLAFKASPDAGADPVAGMFLIEPRDTTLGPHLLYRPLFDPPLSEYVSRQALLDAIGQPGALQDSVLARLPAGRVAVYAHGGFREPHIDSVLPGDESAPLPSPPAPATLGSEEVTGDYVHHLFHACIDAVIRQADLQLLSNAEKRWARLKDSGWQLFSSWLMFASGPLTQAGWLILLYRGVRQDLAALQGDDEEARAQAWADMLSNLAAVLLHEVTAGQPQPFDPIALSQKREPPPIEGEVSLERIAPPAAPDELPPLPFDLSWSNPRGNLSAASRKVLEKFGVKVFDTPPRLDSLGAVSTSGPNKGLVHLDSGGNKGWHVLIDTTLYQVAWSDDGPRLVDATGSVGPFLERDEQGQWRLDLRLRLRGGSGRETVQARLQRKLLDRASVLHGQVTQASSRVSTLSNEAETLNRRLEAMSEGRDARNFTDRQRSDKRREYLDKLVELQAALEEKILLIRAFNDNRQVVSQPQALASALVDNVRTCRMLLNVSLAVGREGSLTALQIDEMLAGDTATRYDKVIANLKNNADLTDRQIVWSTREHAALDELRALPDVGPIEAAALEREVTQAFTPLDWQAVQLPTLLALTMDELPAQITLQLDDQVFAAIKQSAEQTKYVTNTINRLTAEDARQDRIDALQTAIGRYDETLDLLRFLQGRMPDQQLREYATRLSTLLGQLRERALTSLSGLWDDTTPAPGATAPRPGPSAGNGRKKFIRTRNREVFVGRVRAKTPEQEDEIVEITDPNGRLVSAFKENREDAQNSFWEEVKAKPAPAPAPGRGKVGLPRLMTQGRAAREGVQALIRQVMALTGTSKEPQSLQELLEHKAQKLTTLADDIQEVLTEGSAKPDPVKTAEDLRDGLRQDAALLVSEGRTARIAAIKKNLPQLTRLQYLKEQDQVDIHRAGGRQMLRRDDFLQEYVISHKDGRPLWYAHFHYPTATTVDTEFASAHLKTLAQRRLGARFQAAAREQAATRIQAGQGGRAQLTLEIHRGEILNRSLAQALFFNATEPDKAS